jgi:hypothetical protein
MKVHSTGSPSVLQILLTGAAISLVGCQSGDAHTTELIRPAAAAIEAGASLQEDGEAMGSPSESQAEDGSRDKSKDKATPEERLDDATEKRVLAEQARSYADTESQLAQLKQQAGEIEVAESLREKREALKVARDELARFEGREMPLERREADLSLERSGERVLKAETDLANMREIMGEEAEAKNKEEIIRRYETSYRFAQEGLAIEKGKRELMVDAKQPSKLAKLSSAVRTAEAKLQAEEIHADRKRQAADLEVRKAGHALDKAKRKLKKANQAEKKLKREAKAAGEKK